MAETLDLLTERSVIRSGGSRDHILGGSGDDTVDGAWIVRPTDT